MKLLREIQFLIHKEFLLEWRSKYALNGILLYVVTTIFTCYLAFKEISAITWNTLLWIILLFVSMNALAKSFVQENRARQLYYDTIASAEAIILAKIIYNSLLLLLLSTIAILFHTFLFSDPIADHLFYFLSIILGSTSFAAVFTMIAGISSKTNNKGSLIAVLGFPIIIPLLTVLIKFSKNAMDGLDRSVHYDEIVVLLAIDAIVIASSLVLFPYLRQD